jgi:Icc-related predicted phosphoesterase
MAENYKVVMLSDTHNMHSLVDLPDGDLLIFAGDMSGRGFKNEVKDFLSWLKRVSRRYTFGSVFIAGNHDRSFDPKYCQEYEDQMQPDHEGKPLWLTDMLQEYANPEYGVRYLENETVTIKDLKIWGSPFTPWFYGEYWAFNKYRGEEINEIWKTIPTDADIIVTHGPTHGTLDFVYNQNIHVGCEDLAKVVEAIKPKLFVCGHIHEGYGMTKRFGSIYVNASICDVGYKPVNKPKTISITK